MKQFNLIIKSALAIAFVSAAGAATAEPRDRDLFPSSGPRQESQFERNAKEFKSAYEREQREKTAEKMRDKTHDGRVRIGGHTSIGASGDGINVRHDY